MTAPIPPNADELVSAYLDGVAAPDEIEIVESSPDLMAQVDALRRVTGQLSESINPPEPAVREAHLAAALGAFDDLVAAGEFSADEPPEPEVVSLAEARDRRRSRRLLPIAAAAALALLFAGIVAVGLNRGTNDDVVADTAADTASSDGGDDSAAVESSSAMVLPQDDAGDGDDADAMDAMEDEEVAEEARTAPAAEPEETFADDEAAEAPAPEPEPTPALDAESAFADDAGDAEEAMADADDAAEAGASADAASDEEDDLAAEDAGVGFVPSWFVPALVELEECARAAGVETRCYELTTAADRDDPSGGLVTLPVRVTVGLDSSSAAPPIVIPAGGPGFGGLGAVIPNESVLLQGQAVVEYDQRGTGRAVPSLDCPEVDEAFVAALRTADDPAAERSRTDTAHQECLARLTDDGVDLTDYTSLASAHDLEDLRLALGYDQWNILGISYGARLALVTAREHPDGVRALVLDSVYDVRYGGVRDTFDAAQRAVDALVDSCAASPDCAARGDLAEMLDRIRLRHNEDPIPVTLTLDGESAEYLITGDDLMAGLFNAMYDERLIPLLPGFIAQVDQGVTAIVSELARSGIAQATGAAEAMGFAVNCADNAGLDRFDADLAAIDDPGRYSTVATGLRLCPPDWPATSEDFNDTVVSEIPALIAAGAFDPITPPDATAAVADGFPNSTYVERPGGAHGVIFGDDCTVALLQAFLANPDAPLDLACVADLAAPDLG